MVGEMREAALALAAQQREQQLDELLAFIRIPSVSTQPEHTADVRRAAGWLMQAMIDAGLENARLFETSGHPLVYADWLHAGPGAPTVLIYGHYDVQPVEPLELWHAAPFEPRLENDYLYARGVSDDKGQVFIHIKAVAAYLQSSGRLPINVKFIVEGEEEIGGPGLEAFVPQNKELLAADVVLISDSAMMAPNQPSILYGLRGLSYMLLDLQGPSHDLHSGQYGGAVDNPLNVMGHIIARLKDMDGRVLIPGFYDDVQELDDEERQMLADSAVTTQTVIERTGAPALFGEQAYSVSERTGVRPSLDVNGIVGGYTGEGGKTIIPSSVHAKISMRLVPHQNPEKIAAQFEAYVRSLTPPTMSLTIRRMGSAWPVVIDYNTTAMAAASAACESVFGARPLLRREGGTIPVVSDFQKHLGLGSVMLGFGLPDDRIHSPNERFYLPNFYNGIATVIHFIDEYARRYGENGA